MSIKVINWFESQHISCVIDADWKTTTLKFNFTQHQAPPFSGRELLYYDFLMATRRMNAVSNLYHNPSSERIMGGPQFLPVLKALYDFTFKALERIEERLMNVDAVLAQFKNNKPVFEVQVDGDDVYFNTTTKLDKWTSREEREYYEYLLEGEMRKAILKYWTQEVRTNALMGIGERSFTTAAISKLTKAFQDARKGKPLGLSYYTVNYLPPAPAPKAPAPKAPAPAPKPAQIVAIKKATPIKPAKTVTMKSLVVETLTWDNLAIAKYGTAEGLKPGQKAAVTREFNRRAPKAPKKTLKAIVINEPINFSNLAIAMYGTDQGLSRGRVGAINREINRRNSYQLFVLPRH